MGLPEKEDAPSEGPMDNDPVDEVLRAIASAPPRTPPTSAERGARWGEHGRYVIERRLGRGGMGTVYLASDTLLDRSVALKVLDVGDATQQPALRQRLIREARLAAKLEHERVARVYDVGEHEGNAFVALEYIPGASLRGWMSNPHTPAETVAILIQIAEGLRALHEKGVVHRDLKPENVMLPLEGGVKLLDFGLAGHLAPDDQRVTALRGRDFGSQSSSTFFGTPGYMAPEQFSAVRADARADIFALGIIAAELIDGQRPFKGSTRVATKEEQTVQFDGPNWKLYPPLLAPIVSRMLRNERNERYSNGAEVLRALQGLRSSGMLISAYRKRIGRKARVAAGGLVLCAAGVGAVGPAIQRTSQHRKLLAATPPGMALIDVGSITLGKTQEELDLECAVIGPACNRSAMRRETPRGQAQVAPFFIDIHEATNDELVEALNRHVASLFVVLEENDHLPRYVRFHEGLRHDKLLVDLGRPGDIEYTAEKRFRSKPGRGNFPAVRATWFGANLFCATHFKRLPTENEWEAAARGSQNRSYPWGSAPLRCGGAVLPNDGMIQIEPGCSGTTAPLPVGSAAQDVTPEGVHDLGGNVSEWTDSVYVEEDRMASPDLGFTDVPRVIRGGSWASETSYLARSTGRTGSLASQAGRNLGFRCARSPLPSSK